MNTLKMTKLRTYKSQWMELGLWIGIGLLVLGVIGVFKVMFSTSESPISAEHLDQLRQHSWPSPHSAIPLIRGV